MSEDQTRPVLEYRNLMQTPPPRFKWRLYFGGVFTAFGGPCLAALLIASAHTVLQGTTGDIVTFGTIGLSVVAPLIAAIGSLLNQNRRAFGLGVFTVYGMALLALGLCVVGFR